MVLKAMKKDIINEIREGPDESRKTSLGPEMAGGIDVNFDGGIEDATSSCIKDLATLRFDVSGSAAVFKTRERMFHEGRRFRKDISAFIPAK